MHALNVDRRLREPNDAWMHIFHVEVLQHTGYSGEFSFTALLAAKTHERARASVREAQNCECEKKKPNSVDDRTSSETDDHTTKWSLPRARPSIPGFNFLQLRLWILMWIDLCRKAGPEFSFTVLPPPT